MVHLLVKLVTVVRRRAEGSGEVRVFDRDHAAGPHGAPHSPEKVDRPAEVLQQEPAVDDVVRAGLIPIVHARRAELDVRQIQLAGGLPSEVELDAVNVDPYHRTLRPDEPRQLKGNVATAAAQVDAPHPRADAGAAEEVHRAGSACSSEELEALVAGLAAADHITLHRAMIRPACWTRYRPSFPEAPHDANAHPVP